MTIWSNTLRHDRGRLEHHKSREVTGVQLRRKGLTGGVVCAQLVARWGTTCESCQVLWLISLFWRSSGRNWARLFSMPAASHATQLNFHTRKCIVAIWQTSLQGVVMRVARPRPQSCCSPATTRILCPKSSDLLFDLLSTPATLGMLSLAPPQLQRVPYVRVPFKASDTHQAGSMPMRCKLTKATIFPAAPSRSSPTTPLLSLPNLD